MKNYKNIHACSCSFHKKMIKNHDDAVCKNCLEYRNSVMDSRLSSEFSIHFGESDEIFMFFENLIELIMIETVADK